MVKSRSLYVRTLAAGILIFCACHAGCGNTKELRILASLGKDSDLQDKEIEKETRNFLKIRDAVLENRLSPGIEEEKIVKKYGPPVIRFPETGAVKYIYKDGNTDWLQREKIYLFFDEQGKLLRWECLSAGCAAAKTTAPG